MSFAFLIHPRTKNHWQHISVAFATEKPSIVSIISGQVNHHNIDGMLVSIPMSGEEIISSPRQALNFVNEAVVLATDNGAEIIGLGALTGSAPVSDNGTRVNIPNDVAITSGNSLTAFMTVRGVERTCEKTEIDIKDQRVAIIGSTGSVGQGIATLLAKKGVKSLILIARNQHKLAQQLEDLQGMYSAITGSNELGQLSKLLQGVKIVIVTTSASDTVLTRGMLAQGTIVYDDTVPRNTIPDLENDGVLVVDGATLSTPDLNIGMYIGLPSDQSYSCLGETILLSIREYKQNFSIGKVRGEKAELIGDWALNEGIDLAPLCSFGVEITDQEFANFGHNRKQIKRKVA